MNKYKEKEKAVSEMDEEMANAILLKFVPRFIVDFDLYDLYIKNEDEAMIKLLEKIDEHKDDINSMDFVLVSDFYEEKEALISFINRLSNNDVQSFSKMFLFYAVSLFENMIDEFLQNELLWANKMSLKKANELLAKLSANDKLDYLLKLLTDVSFIDKHAWSQIKPVIQARNFYIHYKPQEMEKNKKFSQYIKREAIIAFLENASQCYEFLYSNRNKEMEEYLNKVESIKILYEERRKNKTLIKDIKDKLALVEELENKYIAATYKEILE